MVFNDYFGEGYSLDACADRIGFQKDGRVEAFIDEHKLWDWSGPDKPGSREKLKHFERVPFDVIVPYAERDAEITYHLARHQKRIYRK